MEQRALRLLFGRDRKMLGVTRGTAEKLFINNNEKDLLGVGGAGYAWVDETANRVGGVTYTNTYSKPIMVSIQHNYNSTYVSIVVNGVKTSTFYSSGYAYPCVTTIVPAGATYMLSNSTVKYWAELK